MNYYAQNDNRWRNNQLGTCNTTIGESGCFITSLAMLDERNPAEINEYLRDNGGYIDGCMIDGNLVADKLGLKYDGYGNDRPDFNCIAETHDYEKQGYPQHFFILFTNGEIVDPLIGERTANHYNIVRYHYFHEKGEDMGFDENHVFNIYKNDFEDSCDAIRGEKIDGTNDANYALELTKQGSTTASREQHQRYWTGQTKWVLKSEHDQQIDDLTRELNVEKERADKLQVIAGNNQTVNTELDTLKKELDSLKKENENLKKSKDTFIQNILKFVNKLFNN